MNFREIFDATRKICAEKRYNTLLCDMSIRDFEKRINRMYNPGGEDLDMSCLNINTADHVINIYAGFKEILQFAGMVMSAEEDDEYNEWLWEELTEILAVLREVLVQNFPVELPEARVVSLVTEAVEEGLLEEIRDEDGRLCVRPNENYYNLRIKIKWLKIKEPLPARKQAKKQNLYRFAKEIPPGYKDGFYAVPKMKACEILHEVSPEGANWFVENFGKVKELIFHLDEAEEIVP